MEYLVVSLMFIVFLQTRFMELRRATLCLAVQSALIAAACLVIGAVNFAATGIPLTISFSSGIPAAMQSARTASCGRK